MRFQREVEFTYDLLFGKTLFNIFYFKEQQISLLNTYFLLI